MNCGDFKDKISQKIGYVFYDADEKIHLEQCSECRDLYENYVGLEKDLKSFKIKPLSSVEFAMVQQKLDLTIDRYQRRAVSLYSLLTRYGAGLMTVLFLFFVSLWSGFEYGVYYTENTVPSDTYYLADNGYEENDEDETMDDDYIGLLLYDYTQNNGFNSGDLLLGELTADEFEYLENSLDLGDIL